ncbi:MAG: hypothetical protein F4089_13440 [Gammaproteobacteria bacterium]|nr:hypothetical protein [Gammaproteobacteria bacterium]MYJ76025.1 hypothetical protein [Gammaproteobacteria bacterium]
MNARTMWLVLCICSGVAANAGTLSGPVTGGERGSPFAAVDVADQGYLTEEYFLEGQATAYELADGSHTADGKWKTRPAGDKADFKTRLLVVRPKDPAVFNGTAIVFWLNVTAGFELGSASGEALRGYAWVGVSAQQIGIDGFPQNPQGLKAWDPERYGALVHPGDAYSYDIFTQAAMAVGPDRPRDGLDPMSGLAVERLIAVGASQSAGRLRSYVNGVHQLTGVFDGYIPFIDFGRPVAFGSDLAGQRRGSPASIRADLDVPVIVVNSETEVTSYYGVREADSERFRLWEVAGTSHVSVPRPPAATEGGSNWMSYSPVYNAAVRHMHHWIRDGVEPPAMPRVEVTPGVPRPEVVRDEHGNAVGGIRLPDIAVPTAAHSGFGTRREGSRFGFLYGTATDFDAKRLAELYPDSQHYLQAWNAALDRAVEQGMVLPEDAGPMRERAAAWAKRLDGDEADETP